MIKSRRKSTLKIKTLLSILIILVTFLAVAIPAYAAGSNFHKPSFLNRYEVSSGASSYSPNTSSYPFNSNETTAIGFDALYDSSKGFWEYKGEVPDKIADEDDWKSFRTYNGKKIDGVFRKWSDESLDEDLLKPDSEDLHIYAMTYSTSFFGNMFGSIGLALINGINWIFTQIINLMITLKSFNIADMVSALDNSGELSDLLSKIFLIDQDTGNLSPLMLFGLLTFVGSLAFMAFKVLKGDLSLRKVATEVSFFVLAVAITAIFMTSTNAATIAGVGTDFMTKLANNVVGSASDSTSIFIYNTGNSSMDNSNTQRAIIKKTYIDQLINAQFGYSVNDLYIKDANGNSDFGDIELVEDAIKEVFSKGNIDSLAVATDIDGNNKINNLGYYLWAANSNVRIYAGENGVKEQKNNKPAFYTSGNNAVVRTGSSDRTLFVVDFLNAVKRQDGQTDAIKNKCDKILNNLCQPSYGIAIANVFVVALQNIMLSWASFAIIIFTVIGQLIITLGAFCLVVIPMLLVYGPTRRVASGMMYTYLLGFLRYLIGSALFNSMIAITTILSQQGLNGILVSMVLCFILGKYGPTLIKELNLALTSLGRGKELRFMSKMYWGMNNAMGNWQKSKDARRRNRFIIGEDGKMHNDQTVGDKVATGLRRDGLSFFGRVSDRISSRIPGTAGYDARREDQLNAYNQNQRFNPNENVNIDNEDSNEFNIDYQNASNGNAEEILNEFEGQDIDDVGSDNENSFNEEGEAVVGRNLTNGFKTKGLGGNLQNLVIDDEDIYGKDKKDDVVKCNGSNGLRVSLEDQLAEYTDFTNGTRRNIVDNAENKKLNNFSSAKSDTESPKSINKSTKDDLQIDNSEFNAGNDEAVMENVKSAKSPTINPVMPFNIIGDSNNTKEINGDSKIDNFGVQNQNKNSKGFNNNSEIKGKNPKIVKEEELVKVTEHKKSDQKNNEPASKSENPSVSTSKVKDKKDTTKDKVKQMSDAKNANKKGKDIDIEIDLGKSTAPSGVMPIPIVTPMSVGNTSKSSKDIGDIKSNGTNKTKIDKPDKNKNINEERIDNLKDSNVNIEKHVKQKVEKEIIVEDDKGIKDINKPNNNKNVSTKKQKEVVEENVKPIDTGKLAAKEDRKQKVKLTLKNAGLRGAAAIPVVGKLANETIAKTMHNQTQMKEELYKTISKVISETNDQMTLNQAYEKAEAEMLKEVSSVDRNRMIKSMQKIKSSISKGDVQDIQKRAEDFRKQAKEKQTQELLAAAEMRKQMEEAKVANHSNNARNKIKLNNKK